MKTMKQLFLMYVMILFCMTFIGCSSIEMEWDVTKEPNWETVAKGEVIKIVPIQGCSGDHETRSQWCKEYYEFYIDEKSSILVGKIKNIGLVEVGSTGKLYKRNCRGAVEDNGIQLSSFNHLSHYQQMYPISKNQIVGHVLKSKIA